MTRQSKKPSSSSLSDQPSVQPRLLLRVSEAADFLGVTPNFIRSLRYSHAIPYVVLGKRLLFRVSDLEKYVQAQMKGAA